MGFFNTPTVIAQISGGKLKALGVTSLTRSPLLPGVPTLDEKGIKGFEMNTWFGFVGPARVATATVERLEVPRTTAGQFPAWRIRIRNGGHLPQEESFVWYGRAGYLGMKTHLDFGKPDASGHIEIIEDQSESLTSLSISHRE